MFTDSISGGTGTGGTDILVCVSDEVSGGTDILVGVSDKPSVRRNFPAARKLIPALLRAASGPAKRLFALHAGPKPGHGKSGVAPAPAGLAMGFGKVG